MLVLKSFPASHSELLHVYIAISSTDSKYISIQLQFYSLYANYI